jgi:hypothetical protein
MARMASVAAALVLCVLALSACTKKEPPLPSACLAAQDAGYERALRAAPGEVRLLGVTRISECVRRVRTDADLQNLGLVLFRVADGLAVRARDGADPAAARQLGYLTGAVRAGAAKSAGISAELARRVERAAFKLDGSSRSVGTALHQGLVAGKARG